MVDLKFKIDDSYGRLAIKTLYFECLMKHTIAVIHPLFECSLRQRVLPQTDCTARAYVDIETETSDPMVMLGIRLYTQRDVFFHQVLSSLAI